MQPKRKRKLTIADYLSAKIEHTEQQTGDEQLDFGGYAVTWCSKCQAVYGSPEWEKSCNA